jgi:hypothetical protein
MHGLTLALIVVAVVVWGGGKNNSSISSSSNSTEFVMYLRNEAFAGCPNAFKFFMR